MDMKWKCDERKRHLGISYNDNILHTTSESFYKKKPFVYNMFLLENLSKFRTVR